MNDYTAEQIEASRQQWASICERALQMTDADREESVFEME